MPLDAHYPEPAGVDAYGKGGFRFADMSHKGSILDPPHGCPRLGRDVGGGAGRR